MQIHCERHKNKDIVDQMVRLDEGYKIFRTLRGSPPYWENAKKDSFAMIREICLPTWFISLSAAETHWKPLLHSLAKLIDKVDYSDDELENLTWETKARLIKSDPVTVARYFDYRVKQFMHLYILSQIGPLGVVEHFWYRIEFQNRGSPHLHGLLWVQNAPQFGKYDNIIVENFISKHLSTLSTFDPLVDYQKHRHSHTCRKGKKRNAALTFPFLQ